jgi:hypothetical protein
MTDEKQKKKRMRVEGIQYHPSMEQYAEDVEKKMLALIDDGYSMEIHEQDDGMLLVGVLRREEESGEHPFLRFMKGLQARAAGPRYIHLGERSSELFERFETILDATHNLKAFAEEAKKNATILVAGFNVEEITTSVAEFEKEAEAHPTMCGRPAGHCILPDALRTAATILKDTAKTQLQ